MNFIWIYISAMIPYMLLVLPFFLIGRAVMLFYLHKKGRKTRILHELGLLAFALFLTGLLSQTISPTFGFKPEIQGSVSLIPFQGIIDITSDGVSEFSLVNVLGNICMFVPIGFFIPLLWRQRGWKVVLYGFCLSAFIEFCQLFLIRATDIDDLILNTLGTAAGLFIYSLFSVIVRGGIRLFRLQDK